MSPRRIESRSTTPEGVRVTQIKEKAEGFTVTPNEATRILGMPRTTLFRYDGPDVQREPLHRGGQNEAVRTYSDEALLRIARASERVSVKRDKTGLTLLSVQNCDTILNIPWLDALTPKEIILQISMAMTNAKKWINQNRPLAHKASLECADELQRQLNKAVETDTLKTFSFEFPREVAKFYIVDALEIQGLTAVPVPKNELDEGVNLSRYAPTVVPNLLSCHTAIRDGKETTPQKWHYRLVGIDLVPESVRKQLSTTPKSA